MPIISRSEESKKKRDADIVQRIRSELTNPILSPERRKELEQRLAGMKK